MTKKVFFSSILKLVLFLVIFLLMFFGIPWLWNVIVYSYVPYDTSWIRGKTAEEIIERYGEPCRNFGSLHEYDLDLLFRDEYYYIEFDENGLANEVYIAECKGG